MIYPLSILLSVIFVFCLFILNLARGSSIFIDLLTDNYDTQMPSDSPFSYCNSSSHIWSLHITKKDGLSSSIKFKLRVACKTFPNICNCLCASCNKILVVFLVHQKCDVFLFLNMLFPLRKIPSPLSLFP